MANHFAVNSVLCNFTVMIYFFLSFLSFQPLALIILKT